LSKAPLDQSAATGASAGTAKVQQEARLASSLVQQVGATGAVFPVTLFCRVVCPWQLPHPHDSTVGTTPFRVLKSTFSSFANFRAQGETIIRPSPIRTIWRLS